MTAAIGSAAAAWAALREAAGTPIPERLLVSSGSCADSAGSPAVLAALRADPAVRARGIPVVAAGCDGRCHAAVTVLLRRAGKTVRRWERVAPDQATAIAAALDEPADAEVTYPGQTRRLLRDVGAIDPLNLDEALRRGRYRAFAEALDGEPGAVVDEIERSGLTGRGGAYFPVGIKWRGCLANDAPRYLVVNAEEGEPGVVKDRHLLEGDPHLVIEGMLIAAYAIGAERVVVYVNGHARTAGERLRRAIDDARECGLVGERILGSSFSCEIALTYGAGGYVLGEESALLESLEGRRPMPRAKPPLPVKHGLFGRPTAINNCETLAATAQVIEHGAEWFREVGAERWPGTKLVTVSGNVARPGVVEIPLGTTAREIIALCGGASDGAIQAVLTGGPSGSLVRPDQLDRPLVPRDEIVFLGSGNLTVIDERQDLAAFVRGLAAFNAAESCGKCTPCREGTRVLVDLLGRMDAVATPGTRAEIEALCEVVASASLCGLGQMAPNPVRSWLTHFVARPAASEEGADA